MLSLHHLARQCALDAERRKRSLDSQRKSIDHAAALAALIAPFETRLVDACRQNRVVTDELTFVALPDRLLARAGDLAGIGNNTAQQDFDYLSEEEFNSYRQLTGFYHTLAKDVDFVNLDDPGSTEKCSRQLLMCHGLSPIGDSILLLAELGRVYRASIAMNSSITVMLADISWMSSNRSIRQFKTLNDLDIDRGLRFCLDNRNRLYKHLDIKPNVKEVSRFDRKNTISGKKLDRIAKHYSDLVQALWGPECLAGRLQRDQIQAIAQPLEQYGGMKGVSKPQHIEALAAFRGALRGLESGIEAHLGILRTIAKQFNAFDSDIFSYFFAQYYAQDDYRGSVVKIAPASEKLFDEPFDRMDAHFRAWGDGSRLDGNPSERGDKTPLMSAIYLGQYQLGNMTVLPYTPLSLDALRQCDYDHNRVYESLIMVEAPDVVFRRALPLLKRTKLGQRNRLIADTLSFLMFAREQLGPEAIDEAKKMAGVGRDYLASRAFPKIIDNSLDQELGAQNRDSIRSLWKSWLHGCGSTNPTYIPPHIGIMLLMESDWTDHMYESAAALCAAASGIVHEVV